jgi:oligoribonuclease
MNIDKQQVPTKLLWVDLEMTGLDSENDLIIEVAVEVTDFNFKTLNSYETVVKQPHAEVIQQMAKGGWWRNFPDSRNDILSKLDNGKDSAVVESELIAILNEFFPLEPAILAGNSIHNDRRFIAKTWPELDLRLHYRMLDVSAFKVLMQGKYGVNFEKKEIHRASDDIQASIAELQYYLEWFSQNL